MSDYEDSLQQAGFVDMTITLTHQVGDGVHGAIIKATKPDAA